CVLRGERPGGLRRGWLVCRDGRFHGEGASPRSRSEGRSGRISVASTGRHGDRLGIGRSEGQLAQADREREEGFLPSDELGGLQDGVQIADRVLLLAHGPLTVEIYDRREELVEWETCLECMAHGLFRGRRLVSQARLEGCEEGRPIRRGRLTEPEKVRITELRRQGAIQLPQEPRVLGRREEATREARGVDLAQRVT